MSCSPLLTVCWYLTSGIYQFFKRPLLLTHLTTLPDWFGGVNDVYQILEVYFWEAKNMIIWWDIDELVCIWFNCLSPDQPSHQIVLHDPWKNLFSNGLPAVSGSRLYSIRCQNNILPMVLINKPASSWWGINQSLMPIVKIFCSWCQKLCAKLVITDFLLLAVVSDTSIATSYRCIQTEAKWLY